jgi:hypothetical protein
MKPVPLKRRTVLRGLGSALVGLPLLEEMLPARGEDPGAVPVRAFNLFFGLGIPAPLQEEGFDGVLEPLKPLRDKLAILRHVDQVRCDAQGVNAHFDGASGAFTATPPDGEARAGGPSIDQVVRQAHYPDGLPAGMVPTLVAGTFFRRSRISRYVHSYRADGTVAGLMQERPRDLFERVFGRLPIDAGDPDRARLKRSVLDAMVSQYRFFSGANSPLGAASKGRLKDHLDRVREYERRAYSPRIDARSAPLEPPPSRLAHGGAADPGGEGIDITLGELTSEWRLMSDLYALAIRTDRARFGSLTFLAAGERLRIRGSYEYGGRRVYEFNDARDLNAGGSKGCSHEWWHKFGEKRRNEQLRAHAHMKMREVAYFLSRLAEDDARDPNGRTILQNSMITVSTESGDGRHSDVRRELSGVFHAISGANGRFKTGSILDLRVEGIDLYNTMLAAMGAKERLGPADREGRAVESIRA